MATNLTCTQVSALLSFYIDDKLSNQLKQFVEAHLEICLTCKTKLETLRSMIKTLRETHEKMSVVKSDVQESASASQNEEFKINLSAYIDNELSDDENIKLKKYIIANPKARQELEGMYNLKKVMHNSFEKTRNESKEDFSKFILRRIDIQEEVYGSDSFAKVVALFIVIFAVFTLAALVIIWV
jgi:anti-sigma factor RsiW